MEGEVNWRAGFSRVRQDKKHENLEKKTRDYFTLSTCKTRFSTNNCSNFSSLTIRKQGPEFASPRQIFACFDLKNNEEKTRRKIYLMSNEKFVKGKVNFG